MYARTHCGTPRQIHLKARFASACFKHNLNNMPESDAAPKLTGNTQIHVVREKPLKLRPGHQ